jgi:hypothetical protein
LFKDRTKHNVVFGLPLRDTGGKLYQKHLGLDSIPQGRPASADGFLIPTMNLVIVFIIALTALVVGLFTYCLYLTKGEEAESRPSSCWMLTPEHCAECTPTGQPPDEAQRQKEMPMSDEPKKKPEEIAESVETSSPEAPKVLSESDLGQVVGGANDGSLDAGIHFKIGYPTEAPTTPVQAFVDAFNKAKRA